MLAASVAAGGLALPVASARAEDSGALEFTINGQPGPRLSYAQLDSRKTDPVDYTVRIQGVGDAVTPINGTSVQDAVALLGILPSAVTELSVRRASGAGHSVVIGGSGSARNEITDGFGGDPKGLRYAVFNLFSDHIGFFRPLRGAAPGEPEDANSDDQIDLSTTDHLIVDLTTRGQQLTGFQATFPPNGPPSDPFDFAAQVGDGAPSGAVFHWDFGDGTNADGPNVSHRYAEGTWVVRASVTTPDGSWGFAGDHTLVVGSGRSGGVAPTPVPTPAGGAGSGGAGSGGGSAGTGSGSTSAGGAAGPAKSNGSSAGARDPGAVRATPTKRSPSRTARATPAPTAAPTAAPAATPTPTPAATPAPGATGAAAGTPTGPATAAPAAEPTPGPTSPGAAGSSGGTRISGLLANERGTSAAVREAIAAAEALAAQPQEEQAPSRAAAGSSTGVLGWIGGGFALIGLLGLGAVREGVRASGLPIAP